MIIQLDYNRRELTVQDNINLGKFFKHIRVVLPDWYKWNLNTTKQFTIETPIVIQPSPRPWWEYVPNIIYDGNTGELNYNNSVSSINMIQLEIQEQKDEDH